MGGSEEPCTPVLSHQKVIYVTGNKVRSFSGSSRVLPMWL